MKKRIRIDKSDIFLWLGAVVICGGVVMINIPAAIILFGLFLVIVSFSAVKPVRGR